MNYFLGLNSQVGLILPNLQGVKSEISGPSNSDRKLSVASQDIHAYSEANPDQGPNKLEF